MMSNSQRLFFIIFAIVALSHFTCSCGSFLPKAEELQIEVLTNKQTEISSLSQSTTEEARDSNQNIYEAQAFSLFLTNFNFSAAWYSKDFSYNQITTGARELFLSTCTANSSNPLQPNDLYCKLTTFISSQDYLSARSLGFYFNKTNSYTLNSKNSTITFTAVPTSISTQNNSQPITRNSCNIDVTYSFININTDINRPFNYSTDSVEDLGVEISIYPEESCGLSTESSLVLLPNNTTDTWQLYSYVGLMTGVGLIQLISCGVLISKLIQNDNLARRTAVGTLSFLITFDFLVYLLHFNYWTVISSWMALIFIVFFICSVFVEPVLLYYVFDALRRESSRSLLVVFYKLYFWMLLSGAGLVLSLTCLPNGMFYAYPFFLLPQIIDNFTSGRKYKWNYWLIFGLGLSKILYITYLFADTDNIFNQGANYSMIIYSSVVIISELIILKLQTKWPRLGFKGKNSNQHTYMCNQDESTDVSHELCSICMEKLGLKPLIPGSEPLLDYKGETQILKTPCKHYYHSGCLREWTKKKLECPNCRQEMPALEEDDE